MLTEEELLGTHSYTFLKIAFISKFEWNYRNVIKLFLRNSSKLEASYLSYFPFLAFLKHILSILKIVGKQIL